METKYSVLNSDQKEENLNSKNYNSLWRMLPNQSSHSEESEIRFQRFGKKNIDVIQWLEPIKGNINIVHD